jgi:hypothetical membrane protein
MLRILALSGIAAPILFAILVIVGGIYYEGYSHVTQAISELGGAGAPNPLLQNINFFILGVLVIAFAFGLHRGISDGEGSKLGPILIGIFGLSSGVANAFLPCDPGCEFESFTGAMHNLTGLGGFIAACAGIILVRRRMKEDLNWKAYGGYSLVTGIVAVISLIAWIGVSKAAGIDAVNGVLQRVFAGVVLLWIEVVAIQLFRLSRQSPV